jgi:hypothetical protein
LKFLSLIILVLSKFEDRERMQAVDALFRDFVACFIWCKKFKCINLVTFCTAETVRGHWQARIKVASSKKGIYLGTFCE